LRKAQLQVAAGEPCAAQLECLFDERDRDKRATEIKVSRASAMHALGESYRDGLGVARWGSAGAPWLSPA